MVIDAMICYSFFADWTAVHPVVTRYKSPVLSLCAQTALPALSGKLYIHPPWTDLTYVVIMF